MRPEDVDNTEDPVADDRFSNIVAYDDELDSPPDDFPCATMTMEQVNPDG